MALVIIRLFAATASIAVMLLFNFSNDSLLWSAIQNTGHFLIFTVLAYGNLALLKPATLRHPLTHLIAVLALLSLGGLIELVQNLMPDRNASWNDLLLDAAGILMGYLIFLLTRNFRALSITSSICLVTCGLIIGFLATQPALKLSGYHLLKTGAPAIVSFSDPFVETTISVTGNASVELIKTRLSPDTGLKRVLRMDLADDNYSGVIFHDTAKLWTTAGHLEFALHNMSQKRREIALRIHDRHHNNDYHDRYNMTLLVKPGANAYRFQITDIESMNTKGQNKRQLDMENIHEIQLFSIDSNPFSLYLSDINLTQL
jgi:VanZ family protein